MTRQPITKFTSPEFAIYVYGDGGVELHNHSAGALAFNSRDELLRMVEFIAQHDLSLRIVRVNGNPHAVSRPVAQEIKQLREDFAHELVLNEELRTSMATAAGIIEGLHDNLSRLQGESAPHKSGDRCLSCERLATEAGFPYCDQCLLEVQLEVCCENNVEWYKRWRLEKARTANPFKWLWRKLFGNREVQ